ncbi:MAG: T9SS type A sorting domain-containing protein [Flavobacteriales bacterium]|nr:T9SS type A sorting domain-containing protein [Flavobacteriales bacterium]
MNRWGLTSFACFMLASSVVAQWQSVAGGVSHQLRAFWNDTINDRLLVSGNFPFAQGGALRVNNIAWWDGTSWSGEGLANGNGNQLEFGTTDPIYSVVMRGDTVFAGHGGIIWHDQFDMGYATMLVNGEWLPCAEPNGTLFFLEENGRMFSGGVHDTLYHAYAPGIHEWRNGAFGDIPNMPFSHPVHVYDVEYWHDQYFFGGIFSAFGCTRIVAFDGVNQWSGLGEGVGGYYIGNVCGYGDSLYVGGFLQDGPNVQSQHIQLWDGSAWKPFFPQVRFEGAVWDIQVHDGVLYVSGYHFWLGDPTGYGLLRYDGHQLCSIGGPVGGDVGKIAFYHGDLYQSNNYIPGLEQEWIGRLPLEGLVPDHCADVGPNAIRETAANQALTVYPNPASAQLSLQLPQGMLTAQILVLDAIGRAVMERTVAPTDRPALTVQELPPGTYTVQCMANGVRYLGRFVKL